MMEAFDLDTVEPQIVRNTKKRQETDDLVSDKSSKRPRTAPAVRNKSRNEVPILEDVDFDHFDDVHTTNTTTPINIIKYRRVLRHIPQDIPYVPVSCENGSRVYLRILQAKPTVINALGEEEDPTRLLMSTIGGGNNKLFEDWDRIKAEARILKDKFHRTLAKAIDNENVIETLGQNVTETPEDVFEGESLWVEKYKPRSYMDLLSEENVNRALLHWLKLWDKSVFGNDYLSKVKLTKEKFSKLEAKEKERAEKKNFFVRHAVHVEDEYDESNRPKVKVALLHGPPGLGKTTCAHVVGKHAGYNIREMNASDDRSVEIFRKTLDDTTQSKSEIFQDGRPNCLVIDEIDGAPAATVNVLIDLITGNATEAGKKKLKKILRRPIICICNDLYAPSLKLLKKHVLVLQFHPVTVPILAERLTEISSREKLHLDNGTIQSLCEKSECDIRSCLSTLQFLKKKKCTPKDALFAQIGMKDKSKGIFQVWNDIFTIPGSKKYYDVGDPSKPEARFRSVLRAVQNFGEYEKLQGGVFENYLRSKFKDCYFESIIEGLEWTTWFEDMRMTIAHSQNYVLFGYLPLYFVVSHFLYSQRGWFKINFPSSEISSRLPRYQNIIKGQLTDIAPAVGRYLDATSVVTDLFPALISIIQPGTIRPVPTQIWSARERETLKTVVEIMIAYNLSYTQEKHSETGAYNFNLEPDIEDVIKFKLQEGAVNKRSFPYGVKQLVSREIETEKMRRSDKDNINESKDDTNKKEIQVPKFKVPNSVASSSTSVNAPSKWTKDFPAVVAKDFFGRMVAPSAETTQELLALQRRSSGVYFRFKEGYSNAVRKFVKMRDIL